MDALNLKSSTLNLDEFTGHTMRCTAQYGKHVQVTGLDLKTNVIRKPCIVCAGVKDL